MISIVSFGLLALAALAIIWWRWTDSNQRQAQLEANAAALRAAEECGPCLQKGLRLEMEFAEATNLQPIRGNLRAKITIKEKLVQLGAHCKQGVIYDREGNKIAFYSIKTEWGSGPAPPDWIEREKNEIEALKKEHRVVLMYSVVFPH